MIHTNELMLGNWVELGGGHIVEITGINNVSVSYSYKTNTSRVNTPEPYAVVTKNSIHPIPITEELLEKCGFTKIEGERSYRIDDVVIIYGVPSTKAWMVRSLVFGKIPVFDLHELQNAYFMLTKNHLEVKL